MTKYHHYLNFNGNTEEAFKFYQKVFGGEFKGGIMRFEGTPGSEGLSTNDKNKVMHVSLELSEGVYLMGTDALEAHGQKIVFGNNHYICISPNTAEEAQRVFNALSEKGKIESTLEMQFWGDLFGSLKDQFGVCWMINMDGKNK